MTQSELKGKLYDLVAAYFATLDAKGNIVWGKTKPVNPNSPMVSLGLAQVLRPYRPARRYVDGIVHDSYPSGTVLRVDLFTKGAPTTDEPNVTARYENTAVNDLSDFANFLNSVYADHWSGRNGITIRTRTVQDLTAINNETSWQYRALLEVDVGFMQNAAGHTATGHEGGVPLHGNGTPMFDGDGYALDPDGNRPADGTGLPLPPLPVGADGTPEYPKAPTTPSGGGSQSLADDFTGYFTEVEGPTDLDRKRPDPEKAENPDHRHKEAKRYG